MHAWKAAAKPVVKLDQPLFGFGALVSVGFVKSCCGSQTVLVLSNLSGRCR
jgi:hypothetical protein